MNPTSDPQAAAHTPAVAGPEATAMLAELTASPADGPNGLALCALHHKTFDPGAFTLDRDRVLLVSDRANGSVGLEQALLGYHSRPVRSAQRPEWQPAPEHLAWHGREVFKGAPRHRA